ncbi:hypothetical protein HCA84_02445 [Listeria booriae]|uniref:hypothetical protein n=1 Tax=Listeria booriae TaxID=1552123 RepID=UPI001629B67A|nr:hypothetical protein [Listeria booriae]MBC1893119.1 hypothetical protein [Listeria booriae]MBC1974523.1 hypothetical protein [Listeria booriae]MBC2031815.1 hypothetical protein [Listeria booriae]
MFSALVNFFFCGHEDENGEIKLAKDTKTWLLVVAGTIIFAFILMISVTIINSL